VHLAAFNAITAADTILFLENSAVIRPLRTFGKTEIIYGSQYAATITTAIAAANELRSLCSRYKTIETCMDVSLFLELCEQFECLLPVEHII
jgi:hypothetical protein